MQICVVEHFIDNLPVVEVVDNTAEVGQLYVHVMDALEVGGGDGVRAGSASNAKFNLCMYTVLICLCDMSQNKNARGNAEEHTKSTLPVVVAEAGKVIDALEVAKLIDTFEVGDIIDGLEVGKIIYALEVGEVMDAFEVD